MPSRHARQQVCSTVDAHARAEPPADQSPEEGRHASAGVLLAMLAWRVAAIAVASVVAVSASQQTSAPRGTGAISGRVVDAATGVSVAGAVVYLTQTRGADARALRRERMESGPEGAFAFRNLPAGEFAMIATAPDYLDGALGKRRPSGGGAARKLSHSPLGKWAT
jgi:hypothetical protein